MAVASGRPPMADRGGFYLMHRGWQDHPVFRNEEFSRRDAFVWLIEEAAWQERRVGSAQGPITLKRGQLSHSIRFMAAAWKWDSRKVQRFLKACTESEMIVLETATASATAQTVITLCNYDKYQAASSGSATAMETETPQQRHSSATNEKEVKEIKELDDGDAGEPARIPRADPFGEIGELTARCGRAAGVAIMPNGTRFADQLDTVREWVTMGLDPDTEIIPALEADAVSRTKPRHSLKYYTPTMAGILARREAKSNGQPDRQDGSTTVDAAADFLSQRRALRPSPGA